MIIRLSAAPRALIIFDDVWVPLRSVKSEEGARAFAEGLYQFLHVPGKLEGRFERWVKAVSELPRKQTRVLTWPIVTVLGLWRVLSLHMFLKPTVTRIAAREYGFDFRYHSRPTWETYASLLEFAAVVRRDQRDLRAREMIDVQSFLWVQGSDESSE